MQTHLRTTAIGTLLLSIGVFATPAMSQSVSPSWDADDPTNVAERRQWLALAWNESRTPAQEQEYQSFTFTNEMPDAGLTLVFGELAVFANLYANRLDPAGVGGQRYGILDLLNDDAAVANKFKIFATTGQIVTGLDDDPSVLAKHLEMILDSVGEDGKYSLDGLAFEDGAFVSEKLGLKEYEAQVSPPTNPAPATTPDPLKQFKCDLDYWVKKSLLACMASRPGPNKLFTPENNPLEQKKAIPRFDCDDFTDAMIWFLRKRLKAIYPTAEINGLAYFWYCQEVDAQGNNVIGPDGKPKRTSQGHAIVIIRMDGKYWYVDPQSGDLKGPFDSTADVYDQVYATFAPCSCKAPVICKSVPMPHANPPTGPQPGPPPYWPNPTEYQPGQRTPADPSKPGLDYDDIQRKFCEFLQWACANCPVTAQPGCTPSSLPPGTNPDPCTSLRPYTKPGTVIPQGNPCFVQ